MTKNLGDGRLVEEVSIAEFQAGDINLGNVDVASIGGLTFKGEESITMNGSAKAATLPSGTNFVEISAENLPVRFTLNGTATANSGGYVPAEQARYILKQTTLTSLSLYGASGGVAHLNYYQEP
jgi:hypothetical protein